MTVSMRVYDDRRTTTLSYGRVQFYNPSQTVESFQTAAGSMTGMTPEEYAQMMIAGGRSPEGVRSIKGKY